MRCPECFYDTFTLKGFYSNGCDYAHSVLCERCGWKKFVPSLPINEMLVNLRLR